MNKKIAYNEQAKDYLLKGAQVMVDAVGVTFGPRGRQVGIERTWGNSLMIQDGIGVAKEVWDKDEFVNMGIGYIREAAQTTASNSGDGTTVTTILAYNLIDKGLKLMREKNVNPMVLRKELLAALPLLKDEIKKLSQEVKTREQIRHVAYVSSRDDVIADVVTQAVEKVGSDGLIVPEIHTKSTIEVSFSEGLELSRGYGDYWQFVTNPDRMEAVIEDASVLILGRKVTLVNEITPLLEAVISSGSKSVVIIGEVAGDALGMLLTNKIRGNISAIVIAPPDYGDTRRDTLSDIGLLTGASVVTEEIGMKPEEFVRSFDKKWIGTTRMVIAKKMSTNIIKYEPSDFKTDADKKVIIERNKAILERLNLLKKQRDESDSPYDKEKYQERIARLSTGIAAIKIGGNNETDIREKMERAKDAIPAAQAAVAAGIVPGGGIILMQIAKTLEDKKRNDGEQLLYEVLHDPIKKLIFNTGESPESETKILAELKKKGGNFGFNCDTGKIEDLLKAGIIDPVRVISQALENSVVVASSCLTCECLIAIDRELEKESKMTMA